jgi:hypothetical protein
MKTILLFTLLLAMAAIEAFAQPAPGAQPNSADLMEIPAPDPATTDPAPDPTEDPGGYAGAVKDAFAAGKFFGVILLLWGIGRVLASEKARAMAKFLEGKMARAVVTGLIGVTGAAAVSMGATGKLDWEAIIGAILGTVAAFMTPPEPKPSPAVKA